MPVMLSSEVAGLIRSFRRQIDVHGLRIDRDSSRPDFLSPGDGDLDQAAIRAAVAAHAPYADNHQHCPLCDRKHVCSPPGHTNDGSYWIGGFRVCMTCALLVSSRAAAAEKTPVELLEEKRKRFLADLEKAKDWTDVPPRLELTTPPPEEPA